jgi:hypothetical protein
MQKEKDLLKINKKKKFKKRFGKHFFNFSWNKKNSFQMFVSDKRILVLNILYIINKII